MLKSIIIFSNMLLIANCCLAVFNNDNDFRKYGFIVQKNSLIERAIWGYRLNYTRRVPNAYAYVLAKVSQTKNISSDIDKISFNFRARLYPVAPDTQSMRRVIKAYVKASLGKTKVHKFKNGVICTPAFVVSMNDNLNGSKNSQRSFPIQYSKRSIKLPEKSKNGECVTLLFRDARLLPLNLFSNYDVEITFDYRNRIVSFNCNGNKTILKDNFMKVWKYFGLATLFSTIGHNRNTIIALEYEFSSIKLFRNVNRLDCKEKQFVFPRFNCAYYQELIEREKDIDAMYCLGMNYYEGTGGAEKDYYQAFKWFKKAAMDEHVFGQYYLGLCYLYGRGIEQDNLLAWKWLSRSSKYFYDKAQVLAAQCLIDNVKITNELNRARLLQKFLGPAFFQGNVNAYFLQSYCANNDITRTKINYLEGFKDAARRGHPKAFYYLGVHFAKKKRTLKTAFKCYLESAELGFVPAFVKLGMSHQKGLGTKKDPREAFKWFKKAADEDNAEGIFRLACCYLLGQGVEKDRKQAVKLFIRAVKKSSPRALIALLFLQEKNSTSQFFAGDDEAANDESPSKRNSSYLNRRAICVKYGIGTVKSAEKALKFLCQSPKYNHWMTFELADSYECSENGSRDFYRAIGLYKRAISKGNIRAVLRLAKLYLKLGNKIEAMRYYRLAAKKGNPEAAFELGKFLFKESTSNSAAAQAKAFALFKKAARNGYIRAYYELGDCYYKGQGVEKDATRAAECWEKYETAFLKQQNNSIHGLYWKDLPYQRPIKYDKNGLPLKYQSQLKDKDKILDYYKKY